MKDIAYNEGKSYVKDKDKALKTFTDYTLDKTQMMFTYEGLPETIPSEELEKILQSKGHCLITEVDGELYALSGSFGGEVDPYNRPKQYVVSNVALKLSKTYDIGDNCVLVKNDFNCVGLLPLITKYGALLTDGEISLNVATIISRISMLISAPDDKTKASAEIFIQKILDGDISVIGENSFFDGVKLQTMGIANTSYINQLIELIQYYKASFLNELGLQANYNMKRERLTVGEVLANIDNILPFVENMKHEREKAFSQLNSMFGTSITVDYNGVWKTNQEHSEQEEILADSDNLVDVSETEEPTETKEPTEEQTETEEPKEEQTETEEGEGENGEDKR